MRSSADIYEGMEAAIRKDEQEPLLEGFHDMESTQQPFEVVDNNTPTEELPPRRLPPSLQEQIKACLTVLEEIQSRITEEDKPRIHNYYLYTTLFLMFTVTAITTPAVLIALLKESIYRPPHYSPQELEMIARLETLDQFQKQCEEEIQQEENYYFSQLFVYLKPHYDRWFAKDTHGNSCASRPHPELSYINPDQPFTTATTLTHYVPDLLCYFWKYYKKLTADCVAIAQDGCIASREHPEITDHFPEINAKFNLVLGERALLQREIASIKEPHESWTSIINFPLTGLVTGVGLLALVGLAFTAKKYHDIRVGHHTNMTRAQQLDQCMPDLTHSDVVQLTTRLGIIVNDTTTIKDLISQLTAKSADIDYRRKQRIAFLGGALRNDTDLYHFFRNGGNRDVKKMILDAADLGTSPRPA